MWIMLFYTRPFFFLKLVHVYTYVCEFILALVSSKFDIPVSEHCGRKKEILVFFSLCFFPNKTEKKKGSSIKLHYSGVTLNFRGQPTWTTPVRRVEIYVKFTSENRLGRHPFGELRCEISSSSCSSLLSLKLTSSGR